MKKAQLFIVFAAFLLVVLGFQNCSAPLPPEEEGLATGASTSSKVNFAFNTEIDQLAYMSCHKLGSNFDRSAYFSFRVGAYQPGMGVGLTPQFLQDIANLPAENKKSSLVESPINLGAQPLLSVRNSSNAQQIYLPSAGSGPAHGVDHAKMLGVLSDDFLADEFLRNVSQPIRYKRNGNPEGARLEGSLNLNLGISGLNTLQSHLNNGAMLAINYPIKSTNVGWLRAPAHYYTNYPVSSITTQVYGKGLRLQFRRHPSNFSGAGPSWALGSVGEEDMSLPANNRPRVENKLSCPDSLIFKIVDRRHLTTDPANTNSSLIYCEKKPDNPASLSAGDRELLRRARLSLRVEDWFIDWNRKCIVPKKFDEEGVIGQCYGPSPSVSRVPLSQTVPVEYDVTKPCAESSSSSSVRACVGLASICIR